MQVEIESWRDIPGYEGKYQASSLGRVRNTKNCRVLKPGINTNGYKHVSLGRNNDRRVHRIVALTFLPNPFNLRDVNHKNGIKTDNRVENLEWVSHADNELHKLYKLHKSGKLLKPMKKVMCLENGKTYESISAACRDLGIKTSHISEVCQGKISQTCGYHWRYI